jgi:hypothetical protein
MVLTAQLLYLQTPCFTGEKPFCIGREVNITLYLTLLNLTTKVDTWPCRVM